MAVLALTCGDAVWPGAGGVDLAAVPARPGRDELAPVLDADADRLVVVGDDADLAAVVLRLLRTERLGSVAVGYVPVSPASEVARLWGLPVGAAGAELAVHGSADRVPLVRDDAGGVLLGLGVVRPVRGVAYCDDEVVLRGQASRLEVSPDREHGLVVRVVRRSVLGRRVRAATGRALQLGCLPTLVERDGVPARTPDRWTWYRHTEELRLVRGLL